MSLLKEKYELLEAYNKVIEEAPKPEKPVSAKKPFIDNTPNPAFKKKNFQDTTMPFDSGQYDKMLHMAKKNPIGGSSGGVSTIDPTQSEEQPPSPEQNKLAQKASSMVNSINQLDQEIDNKEKELDHDELMALSPEDANIAAYEDTDLPEWGFKDLEPLIARSYITKEPLLIYGDPGIGKSSTVEYFAEHIAAPSKEKIFKDWRACSIEEKSEIIKNPGKYFVLITELVNKLEPSDLMGVPMIQTDKPYLETQQLKWIYLMSQPEADGILFLDEINLGSPQILQSLYEVVLDKSFAGTKASKDFSIMAAGNIAGMFTANVEPLPRALVDRFTSGVIIAKPEEWLDYAERKQIDRRIIAFVKSDVKNNFYTRPTGDSDPFPTPRSLVKLSQKLKQVARDYNGYHRTGTRPPVPYLRAIGLEASAKCGVKWANNFVLFLSHIRSFTLKNITDDIAKLNKRESGELAALKVFLVNKVKLAAEKAYSPDMKNLPADHKFVVAPEIHEAFYALALVLVNINKDGFIELMTYLRNDFTPQQGAATMFWLMNGDYDDGLKKKLKTRLEQMGKIMGDLLSGVI